MTTSNAVPAYETAVSTMILAEVCIADSTEQASDAAINARVRRRRHRRRDHIRGRVRG